MRKIIYLIAMLMLSAGLFAHPASKVTLSFDSKTKLLTVDYDHNVKSPVDHYINSVVITLDGKEIISQKLPQQEQGSGGSLVFKVLGVKSGSTIEATTTCNKTGKKKGTISFK